MSNKLKAVVSADIKQFTSAMDKVGLTAGAASSVAVTAIASIAAALVGVTAASINAGKAFETQRVRLQLLVGDMAKGAQEFEIVRKMAAGMAFDTETVIDAYIKLRAATGKKFALDTIEALGNASFVAGENMTTLADRFGDLVIKARTGGQGMKETVKSLKAVFGEEGIKGILEAIDEGVAGEDLVALMSKALGRFGKKAAAEIAKTAKGKEDILGGLFKELLAGAADEGALENYKRILDSLIVFIGKLADSQAFKDFAKALGDLTGQIADLVADEAMQDYFLSALAIITGMVQALNEMIKLIKKVQELNPFSMSGLNLGPAFAGKKKPVKDDVETAAAGAGKANKELLEALTSGKLKVVVVDGNDRNVYE